MRPVSSLFVRGAWLTLAALVTLPLTAAAQMAPPMYVDQTHTYTIELTLGPAEQMLSPGEAMGAKSGEVMVSGASMAPANSMVNGTSVAATSSAESTMMGAPNMDQGMAVNHHLEVRVTRNDTGALVNDVTPTIRVTNKATGESRDLPEVMAMYGVESGPGELHYGQNVWLPDGAYMVTVMIGPERSVFRELIATGGALTPMSISGG